MKIAQRHATPLCVMFLMTALSAVGQAAQPLSEGSLALQTGVLNDALPSIIVKAQQDKLKPEEERWRSQRALSDGYLREIRISTLNDGVLSPYEEFKKEKPSTMDMREKKRAMMKPHEQPADRFMIYEFESDNVHKYEIEGRIEGKIYVNQ